MIRSLAEFVASVEAPDIFGLGVEDVTRLTAEGAGRQA